MVKDVVKPQSEPTNQAAIIANSYRQVTKRITPCRVFLLPLVYHTSEKLSTPIFKMQKLRCCSQRKRPTKKVGFIFGKVLDFLSLLWYVVVLTGGTTYEKYDKRTVAWKHNSSRGQQKQLKGDEGATRIHGKTSRILGEAPCRREAIVFDRLSI